MLTLRDIASYDDKQARWILEFMRWPNGAVCVHCSSTNALKLAGKTVRPGLYKCRDCKKQFTVTVGTIFEDSKIGLAKWLYVLARLGTDTKGVSALEIQREIGVAYRTAWSMCHKVRYGMAAGAYGPKLKGIVEVDEAYIGGKARGWNRLPDGTFVPHKRGRGTKKIPLMAMVERSGTGIRTQVLPDITGATFMRIMKKHIHPSARIMTDENFGYNATYKHFKSHETVNHKRKEYARGDVTTNTVESFFATVKRSFVTYHSMSKKHLPKYAAEFQFRWENRHRTTKGRMEAAIKKGFGRRLKYERLVA